VTVGRERVVTNLSADPETAARLEAGRLFFARPWTFLAGVATVAGLPAADGIEVAFAGRSNVGKSSLINALVGQKALARTSNTPGRTRELNLFGADAGIVIVDMPGYGFARAAKADVATWQRLAFDYLRGRPNLRRVYLLIDARHGLKANDLDALKRLDKAAVSYQIVLTKADKLKAAAAIRRHPAAHPEIIATSAATGAGIDVLRAEIAALV
jgi:GTP-binding protein